MRPRIRFQSACALAAGGLAEAFVIGLPLASFLGKVTFLRRLRKDLSWTEPLGSARRQMLLGLISASRSRQIES